MAVLDSGEFFIRQMAQRVSALSDALQEQDPVMIGLSLHTLSIAARLAASQFTPSHPSVMLAWSSWLRCLAFASTGADHYVNGDPDAMALVNQLVSLSHEEYLHLVALAEDADRGLL